MTHVLCSYGLYGWEMAVPCTTTGSAMVKVAGGLIVFGIWLSTDEILRWVLSAG